MTRGFGRSASGKVCKCTPDKGNWHIVGYIKSFKGGYVVSCVKCHAQWNTKAKYCDVLAKAPHLK